MLYVDWSCSAFLISCIATSHVIKLVSSLPSHRPSSGQEIRIPLILYYWSFMFEILLNNYSLQMIPRSPSVIHITLISFRPECKLPKMKILFSSGKLLVHVEYTFIFRLQTEWLTKGSTAVFSFSWNGGWVKAKLQMFGYQCGGWNKVQLTYQHYLLMKSSNQLEYCSQLQSFDSEILLGSLSKVYPYLKYCNVVCGYGWGEYFESSPDWISKSTKIVVGIVPNVPYQSLAGRSFHRFVIVKLSYFHNYLLAVHV